MRFEFLRKAQGKVLAEYYADKSDVISIIGPLGSGKTTESCQKIFKHAMEQEPDSAGVRKSRWLAIRNTYSDLLGTTVKDWLSLYGELGHYKAGSKEPPSHRLKFQLDDETIVDCEIIFLALDRPDSEKKLRGYQVTGVWANEMKELSKRIIDMAYARTGRFPTERDGADCTWHGLMGDSNAPDTDHWLYLLAEKEKPEGWSFHKQAGGVVRAGVNFDGKIIWKVNPDAENIKNLPKDYYKKNMAGKTDAWISVNLANEYGYVSDGKPVYPEYRDDFHNQPLEFIPDQPIYRGWDFGTPACVLVQHTPRGQLGVFKEFTAEKTKGIDAFAEEVLEGCAKLTNDGYEFIDVGDPSGDSASMQREGTSCFSVLHELGIYVVAGKQDVQFRLDSVRHFLNKMVEGSAGFILHGDKCPKIRKGFLGAYKFKRVQTAGEHYKDKPDKTPESHPHDALQYICTYIRSDSYEEEDDFYENPIDNGIGGY